MPSRLLLPLALLLAIGCADDPVATEATPTTEVTPAAPEPLQVWAHAPDLIGPAQRAAARIQAATGLVVEVNTTGLSEEATPLFWSERFGGGKWIGVCGPHGHWVAIDSELQGSPDLDLVVLHEILHALGAEHIEQGAGVMSEDTTPVTPRELTSADLASLCSEAECTRFVPEL